MVKKVTNKCCYQVVFCVKYKKEVLVDEVKETLEKTLMVIQKQLDIQLLDLNIQPYYVKLLIETNDKVAIGKVVYQIKRLSSGILKDFFPHLKSKIPNLWTSESFVKTIGQEDEFEIEIFLSQQKTRKDERNEKTNNN